MSLVSSSTVTEIQLKTLQTAIGGYCTTLKGSTFFTDVLTRAQNFSSGYSTSGEVPTFIISLGDQLVLLWGYQHGLQLHNQPLDISSFSTSKYWQTLFFRLLRDRLENLFSVYCLSNENTSIENEMKRKQKEIDSEEIIELLVQGFHVMPLSSSEGGGGDVCGDDPYEISTKFSQINEWNGFFEVLGSLAIDPRGGRREGNETSSEGLTLDTIQLSLPPSSTLVSVLDHGVDLCAFFEEETLDNLTTSTSTSGATTTTLPGPSDSDLNTATATATVTSPQKKITLSIPSTIEEFFSSALEYKRQLPSRGHPSTLLSEEEVLPTHSLTSTIDPFRKLFLIQIFKSLTKELQFLVKASQHLMFQLSDGQCPLDDLNTSSTLFDLLGVERDECGYQWLVAQMILAIKLRTNGRYRTELEKLQTEKDVPDTSAATVAPLPPDTSGVNLDLLGLKPDDEITSSSLLSLSSTQLLLKYHLQYTKKQIQYFQEMEFLRQQNLKLKYQRWYLSHPLNRAPEPLRIFSEEHLTKINSWVEKYRQFTIVRTRCPIDGSYTSMANNTDLTPLSRYFMTSCSPYHIASMTYGSSLERQHSPYYEHLHTFSRRTIQTLRDQHTNSTTTTNTTHFMPILIDEQFKLFQQLFYENYSHHTRVSNDHLLVNLWISFHLDLAVDQHRDLTTFGEELFSHLERCLLTSSSITDTTSPELVTLVQGLDTQIKTEILWHSDPVNYLENYFTKKSFEERIGRKPSLEKFLDLVTHSPHDQDQEVDLELASEVYREQYALDMEAAKTIGLVE
jgi:hypothetical protein